MTTVTRRTFLVGAAAVACRPDADTPQPTEVALPVQEPSPFVHGIASGDPLADRVILWTRITVARADAVPVTWTVARDAAFADVVAGGEATATPERDSTVKVDATGLQPGTTYHYRFEALGHTSPIGRTKTLPVGAVSRLRLAFTSCSNYPAGYFNVYAAIAARDDLDVVLHLGDYIYEYAEGQYGQGELLGREPEPLHETLSLADYRIRHAIYKRDPDSQAVHSRHPFVTVWDDHESANDAWMNGAGNHSADEGEWSVRRQAAIRAYMEWMPIREQPHGGIERSFRFGDLVDLLMLDTRLVGREAQVDRMDAAALADAKRSLLGPAQEQWLAQELVRSRDDGVAWRLLGQQIIMGQLRRQEGGPWSSDMWDGYDAARRRFLDHLEAEKIRDVIVMTGDIHSSWAVELSRDPFSADERERKRLAVELVTPAVSSPSPIRAEEADAVESGLLATHPHIEWVELRHRGYVFLDVERERARASFVHVATVTERDAATRVAHEVEVRRGQPHLRPIRDGE
jgi:alkaline phosphatase D